MDGVGRWWGGWQRVGMGKQAEMGVGEEGLERDGEVSKREVCGGFWQRYIGC